MGKIRINNMKFYTYNGALGEERILGQNIEVDIELHLPLTDAGKNDDLSKTISYADVYEIIQEYVKKHSYNLMESVAYGILTCLGEEFDNLLKHAIVKVRKYHVPIAGIFDNIEIEMERDYNL